MRRVRHRSLVVCVAAVVALSQWAGSSSPAFAAASEEIATVEQLKSDAFKALRSGHFDQTTELLGRAARMSQDPQIERMAGWTKTFENQRQEFAAERNKQFQKAIRKVKHLISKGKSDYAIDWAAGAYLLADDKKAFRAEPWVDQLIAENAKRAEAFDNEEQWLKALRLYSDLGSLEPAVPMWKDKLKLATRRVRLLALYTPSVLRELQKSESKGAEEVEAILKEFEKTENPTTQPTTEPVVEKDKKAEDDVQNDEFRIDWRESLRGVTTDMLWPALVQARENYFRDIGYADLTVGGLTGLKAVATTKGLEKAFPTLADPDKKNEFLRVIEDHIKQANAAAPETAQLVLRGTLAKLRSVNRTTIELPEEVMAAEFADGAFGELDPFTSMIWPSDLEEFNKTTQGEFSGVGIQIQSDKDGSLKVVSPLEDSPAYKAGIKAGDAITHIDGKNAKGITLNQAVKKITGIKGTMVTLTIRSPDTNVKDYPIRRDIIKVASIKGWMHLPGGGWEYLVDPENKIGYLRLTNFTKETGKELDVAIEALNAHGAKAVILDLRYNPGGLLTAATDVSDKFMKDGVIVTTRPDRDPGNPPTVATAQTDATESELPLVVLVNQYSASASEIVSGALKDHKRAFIVGERTFGKGSVQMLFPLSNREAYLKLTTSHYYLPSGRCIHREENSTEWGVDPDVTVEMTPEQMRAAIDARQDLDVLRDINAAPAEGEQEKLNDKAPAAQERVQPKLDDDKKEKKDLLSSDPQLAAAVLLLRLKLAGAEL